MTSRQTLWNTGAFPPFHLICFFRTVHGLHLVDWSGSEVPILITNDLILKVILKFWTSQCLSSRDSIFIYLLLFRVSACDYQWTLVTITLWEINVHFCCLQRAKFISAFYCYYKAAMHSEPSLMCSKFILCL